MLFAHTRNMLVEVFKSRVVYTIPKYFDEEGLKAYGVSVRNLPDRIEVVFTPPQTPPHTPKSSPDTTTPSRLV
jgi:hypothetical protein